MNHLLFAVIAANGSDQKNLANEDTWRDWVFSAFSFLVTTIVIIFLIYAAYIAVKLILESRKQPTDEYDGGPGTDKKPVHNQAPRVSLNEQASQPKARGNVLSLDSVSGPIAKPAAPAPAPATPLPTPTMPESQASSPVSVGPGDFEKSLAQAGQRMDTLLAQTIELTRQLKLSEKAKTDAGVDLGKAISELKAQIATKDDQIAKLENTLDRKSTYPSLRALLELKKLCLDMIGTQKPLPHDELIAFVTGAIDSQLEKLDIQCAEFPTGTPLDKIPGEQVEVAPRHESTDDPTKHNQVAKLLQPCYFFERDSKRIVIAKALVVLYRLNPPAATTTPPPETPNS